MLLQMHRGCSYNKKIFILCNGIVLAIVMAVWVNVYLGLKIHIMKTKIKNIKFKKLKEKELMK